MLVLTRRPGETVLIDLAEGLDPRTPVGELFAQGPIEIMAVGCKQSQVKLGFSADPRFRILRGELCLDAREARWVGVAGGPD